MSKIVPEKWIQTKVTIGFIIIIAIAIVIFTISYFSVASIIRVQNQEIGNEQEFTYLNQLIFEIIETEGVSRIYGVTGDDKFEMEYQIHHDSVLSIISYLPYLFPDTASKNSIKEIERLYLKKKEFMDQLLQINIINLHRSTTESLLESIPDSLNYDVTEYTYTTIKVDSLNISDSLSLSSEPAEEKKRGFLKRMSDFLSGKKKKDEEEDLSPVVTQQVDSTVKKQTRPDHNIRNIKKQLQRVSRQEAYFNKSLQQHENDLIKLDRLLTEQIKSIVGNLQNISVERNINRRNEMESMRSSFLDRILLLVGSALFLMLFFIFWISRDISKSLKLKNDIIRAKERVDRLLKVKEQFVAHMSHEIRTPLTSIIGFSEQLYGLKLRDKEKSIANRIRISAEHLIGLINNILDFSMLESGKVEFFKDQIHAKDLMEELHHLFDIKAHDANIEFSYEVDPELNVFESDSLRLKQVLINLIGNALKFTHKGSVKYKVELIKDRLFFTVADTGIGIPKDKQKTIFKMFNQVNISLSRKYSGTGLGLSISRQIIEAMGGSISLQSKIDEGSVFKFNIPYIKGKEIANYSSELNSEPYNFMDKTILAIDDDQMICQLIDGILHDQCKRLDVNSSAEMALQALEQQKYDLIMVDLHMPEIDGLQLMKIIRHEKKIETPILFLTADMVNTELKAVNDNKSIWLLAKPFTHNQIKEKLSEIFYGITNNDKPENMYNNHTPADKPSSKEYDLNGVEAFTGGDAEFLNSIIHAFIENTNEGIGSISKAIKEPINHYEIGERAHKMLTGFRQFKIEKAIEILTKMESARDEEIPFNELQLLLEKLKLIWKPIEKSLKEKITG